MWSNRSLFLNKILNSSRSMKRKVLPSFSLSIQKEASLSPYCSKVLSSFHEFQLSNDPENEENAFQSFLNNFSNFIYNETKQKLINTYSIPMIQICFTYSIIYTFNGDRMSLLFSLLDKILESNMITNTDDFSVFMFSLMSDCSKVQILISNTKTLEKLFSNQAFFSDFIAKKHVDEFFDISFLTFVSTDLCKLFRILVGEKSPINLRSIINLHNITASLSIPIQQEAQIEDAILISHLVSVNTLNRTFLNNHQSFNLFSEYIKTADFSIIKLCFNELIFSPPRNFDFFSYVLLFYQKNPQHQHDIFQWIFNDLIKNNVATIEEMNDVMPLFIWVTHSTPITDLISVLIDFSKDPNKAKWVKPFIQPLFSLLCKENIECECYLAAILIVEQQIRQISLSFLYDSFFLQTFVLKIKVEVLAKLFLHHATFSQLVYDIYSLPKAEPQRQDVVRRLIQMAVEYPKTSQFIYPFIIISNSKEILSELMNLVLQNKNHDLCEAFGNIFLKSPTMIQHFLNENGVNWLNKVFNLKIINIQQFRYLINTLTMRASVKSIDKYICNLPKDHPFFQETQSGLKSLLYGFKDANSNYPMKILPLFTYLPLPKRIDPYKAYRIGKHLVDHHPEFIDSPIMPIIANQYVTDSTFLKLVKKDPKSIEGYINPSLDHFPIFQVYEYTEEHPFNVNYSALSFWIKFDDEMITEYKLPFFRSEKLELFIKNTIIITNYDGTEHYENINPYNWINITISIKQQKISHQVKVSINSSKVAFNSPDSIGHFSHFEFSVFTSFMYVGPSIRVYQNCRIKSKDRAEIFQKGPSCLSHLTETFIISPSSKRYLIPGKNVLPVQYKGFASHFLSRRKTMIFLNRLSSEEFSQEDFELMVKSLSSIYSILKNSMKHFLSSILTVFSKQSKHVTINLLTKLLSFVSHFKPKTDVINTVISHQALWTNVPNEIIISALFQAFKDFNFLKQKEQFDMFLIYRSYLNPTNQKLIETLFKASPKCQASICQFLIASHLIQPQSDRTTQCSLGLTSISRLSSSKDQNPTENDITQDVLNRNGYNSESIQCNLDDDISSSQIHLITLEFPNSEFTYAFQNLKSIDYQATIIKQFKSFLTTTKLINLVPLNDVMTIFYVLDDQIRIEIFSLLIEYEMLSPNSIRIDFSFLSIVSQLFKYKSIWDQAFRIVSPDSKSLTNPFYLTLIFSLLWGYTIASLHSVGSTGEPLNCPDHISKIIDFLTQHIQIISKDRNTQKFMTTWFPFLFGFSSPSPDYSSFFSTESSHFDGYVTFDEVYSSQKITVDEIDIIPPSPFTFISNIWNGIIIQAELPHIKNEYIEKLQQYVIHSKLFNFYSLFVISVSEIRNFIEIFGAFLLGPYLSKTNEITKGYTIAFLHHIMTMVALHYHNGMYIEPIISSIHYFLELNIISELDLKNVIATTFLIASVVHTSNQSGFLKLIPYFHLLLYNLLTTCFKNGKQVHFLVQLLNQYIKDFSQIVLRTPKGIDIYLNCLYHIGQLCTDKTGFNTFFSSFVEHVKCQSNPIARQIMLNGFDSELKAGWNPIVNQQISQILSLFKEIIFSSRKIALDEIREAAKIYTISFINYSTKVVETSKPISALLNMSQRYETSRIDWISKVTDIQLESTNVNAKDQLISTHLGPFILPFNLPHLFLPTPSLIENGTDVLKFIHEMNLYQMPLKSPDDLLVKNSIIQIETEVFNCTISRVSLSFPAILIFRQTDFLLIPFSNSSNANPPIQADIVLPFLKEVINGFWGPTLLYQDRILIRIAYDSLYRIESLSNGSFVIWSLHSGHFQISDLPSLVVEFLKKLHITDRYPLKSSLSISSKDDLITRWENSQLSNSELLLGLNLFNNRTLCDRNNFILFPNLSANPAKETLEANLLPNSQYHLSFSPAIEDDSIIAFVKNNFDIDLDGSKRLNQPAFDLSSTFFKREMNLSHGPILDPHLFNDLTVKLPAISAPLLDDERKIYVTVDREQMTLSILDFSSFTESNLVIYQESLPILSHTKHLNVSENALFFSLDFDCDITYVYQVIYSKKHPKSFRFLRDLSFDLKQETKISGIDFLSATRKETKLILWPIFRNTIHRIVDFDHKLVSVEFDEDISSIWALSMKQQYFDHDGQVVDTKNLAVKRQYSLLVSLIDVNGTVFGNKLIDFDAEELPKGDEINSVVPHQKLSRFKVVPQISSISTRLAICGFNDGSLYLLSVEISPTSKTRFEIQFSKLDSPHQSEINNIVIRRNSPYMITFDINHKSYIWSQKDFRD